MSKNIVPMAAVTTDQPFDNKGWVFEIKWDGYRAIAEVKNGKVQLYSRRGNSFNKDYPEIVQSLSKFKGQAVFDGEVVVLDKKGHASFQALQNFDQGVDGLLTYYVFDILFLDGRDLTKLSLLKRKEILKQNLPRAKNIKYSEHIKEKGRKFFEAARKKDLEGIIAKDAQSSYKAGQRSRDWLKIKTIERQEAVIGGFTEPRGGRKGFGALILGVYDKDGLRYIGHTGGGFNDRGLKELHAKLKKLEQKQQPFKVKPKTNALAHWVKPQLVAEIKFQNWTENGNMRKPIFLGLRPDKKAGEVVHEKKTPSPQITNPEKIYWPKLGYTKKDLIDYYQKMGPLILPYLIDRPQSLNRFPHGIDGKNFYQKNVKNKVPDYVETLNVKSKSKQGNIRYLLCQNQETLLYMANLGCIEVNPWCSRKDKLDYPDFTVLDIDPSRKNDFANVIKVAQTVKEVLDEIAAPSYCKTSGKTGLHVFVPLGAKYTYDQAKQFSEIIAKLVNKRLPKITTVERMLNKRENKIYIDYLQNRKGQTLAAPYSLRPTPEATVSTPLKWSEVKPGLDPTKFTIKTIFKRIQKTGDLWKPVLKEGIDLKKTLQNLT